ncbi:BC85_0335 family putative methyltransferase [Mycoplasma sp. 1781]
MHKLIYISSISNGTSKIPPNVRTGLIISIAIALLIAIIALVLSLYYKKKAIKKYLSPNEEREKEKLIKINPNYGVVLSGIKKFYNNDLSDFFVCFVVNTIYLNDYHNIYIEDDDNYLALSVSNLANKKVFFNGTIDLGINEKILYEFPDLKFENIQSVAKLPNDNELIIILNNKDQLLESTISSKINFLNPKGIMIIENNKNINLDLLKKISANLGLRYETLKFKNKSVILLAKNNIKDIVERGEKEDGR